MYREELSEINPSTTGITAADGDGNNWKDIWDLKVPLNVFYVLKPTDLFAAYLVGDDTAEMPNTTRIRVVRRDVTNTEAKAILSEIIYKLAKDFTDKKKLMHLSGVQAQNIVGAEEHIVVQVAGADVAGTGDTDASAGYFKVFTTRRRKAL